MDELIDQVRNILNIDDAADPVMAIAELKSEITTLRQTIASDPKTQDKAEVVALRQELTKAQQKLLSIEAETNVRIAELKEEKRHDAAVAKVEALVAKG